MRKSLLLIPAAAAFAAAAFAVRAVRRPKVNLRGQVVLITGGSRGLGLALARTFAREGCRLMLCARDVAELDRAAADLAGAAVEAPTFVSDVPARSPVSRLMEGPIGRYGRLDIVVNNAGVIQVGPITAMTIEDFEEAMDVMFWGIGVHHAVRAATARPREPHREHYVDRRQSRGAAPGAV